VHQREYPESLCAPTRGCKEWTGEITMRRVKYRSEREMQRANEDSHTVAVVTSCYVGPYCCRHPTADSLVPVQAFPPLHRCRRRRSSSSSLASSRPCLARLCSVASATPRVALSYDGSGRGSCWWLPYGLDAISWQDARVEWQDAPVEWQDALVEWHRPGL